MKYYRRVLGYCAIYLSLWGVNRGVYRHEPQNQQHPEELVAYFTPKVPIKSLPIKKPLRSYKKPVIRPEAALGVQYEGQPDTLLVGELRATVYHAVPAECDRRPLETADDSHIDPSRAGRLRWCGISRGLHRRWNGPLNFGDTLLVTNAGNLSGRWVVRDLMNGRHHRRIDFLVARNSGHDPDQGKVTVVRVWKRTGKKNRLGS